MTIRDLLRYGLWGGVALTAEANRRYYGLQTTWLPHLLTNSLSLLLPDAVRLVFPRRRKARNEIEEIIVRMARDNPNYVGYVAPLAIGYILSNPKANIYKGEWAELKLGGFGLDALPHSLTALALTALVTDSLEVAAEVNDSGSPLGRLLDWGGRHSAVFSLGVLALVTAFWEYGEYRIHQYEMAERGDVTHINMQWSAEDTRQDILSNLIGWAAAILLRRKR